MIYIHTYTLERDGPTDVCTCTYTYNILAYMLVLVKGWTNEHVCMYTPTYVLKNAHRNLLE
jgi:hypothetical protein